VGESGAAECMREADGGGDWARPGRFAPQRDRNAAAHLLYGASVGAAAAGERDASDARGWRPETILRPAAGAWACGAATRLACGMESGPRMAGKAAGGRFGWDAQLAHAGWKRVSRVTLGNRDALSKSFDAASRPSGGNVARAGKAAAEHRFVFVLHEVAAR